MSHKVRLRFCKTGKAKYISHLELMSVMRRTLLRVGVRLRYSEGFNPHPQMSVALPLPVGCGSICEMMDFGVLDELNHIDLPLLINPGLPEGLEVLEVYFPNRKFNEISWVELSGDMYYDDRTPTDAVNRLRGRFAEDSIVITKKTKRGSSEIDICPYITDVDIPDGEKLTIRVKVSAQNPTINPDNLISALEGTYSDLKPDFSFFTRIEVYDRDMNIFR